MSRDRRGGGDGSGGGSGGGAGGGGGSTAIGGEGEGGTCAWHSSSSGNAASEPDAAAAGRSALLALAANLVAGVGARVLDGGATESAAVATARVDEDTQHAGGVGGGLRRQRLTLAFKQSLQTLPRARCSRCCGPPSRAVIATRDIDSGNDARGGCCGMICSGWFGKT